MHAVVQVAFQAAAFGVLGVHDPGAGGEQFVGLAADLVEPGGQFGGQVGVVESERGVAGQGVQQGVVAVAELSGGFGAALDDADLRATGEKRG